MLTKKGSTRANVQFLLAATLIVTVTRLIVESIENNFTIPATIRIDWQQIPDLDRQQMNDCLLDQDKDKDTDKNKSENAKTEPGAKPEPEIEPKIDPEKKSVDNKFNKREKQTTFGKAKVDFKKLFKSNSTNKPILVFYTDKNSTLCKRMERLSLYNPRVRELIRTDFTAIQIGFDKTLSESQYTIYRKYSCVMVPHLEVITADGRHTGSISGYANATEAYKFLNNQLTAIKENKKKRAKQSEQK